MKLVVYSIPFGELQKYLDKYQDKVKFILPGISRTVNMCKIIVDEE